MIFINKSTNDLLQSISMPFLQLRQVELKQPVFGANRIEGKLVAEPQGGYDGVVRWSVSFQNGGAIEFGQAMLEAGRRASANRRHASEYCALPPLPPGAQFYQAPSDAYAPPYHDPSYSFVPQHESFGYPTGWYLIVRAVSVFVECDQGLCRNKPLARMGRAHSREECCKC